MNLLLLEPEEADTRVVLRGRRARHIIEILNGKPGDRLNVGVVNGMMGTAEITAVEGGDQVTIQLRELAMQPPATLPLTLILGLPRPRMLQRTLQTIATMGVQRLCLLQTARVEKSYWQTPLLMEAAMREQLLTGLEQAKATQLPVVTFHKRFRPFMEDELASLTEASSRRLVAHPGPYPMAGSDPTSTTILVVGPEGGLLPQEVDACIARGFSPVQLGDRILRVETAIPVLLGKLF